MHLRAHTLHVHWTRWGSYHSSRYSKCTLYPQRSCSTNACSLFLSAYWPALHAFQLFTTKERVYNIRDWRLGGMRSCPVSILGSKMQNAKKKNAKQHHRRRRALGIPRFGKFPFPIESSLSLSLSLSLPPPATSNLSRANSHSADTRGARAKNAPPLVARWILLPLLPHF